MLVTTTRAGSGDGTALVTAGASERLRIGRYIYLQLLETGPITVVLKFGSATIHSPILLQSVGDGVVLNLPDQDSALAAALYANLSANDIDVSVTVDVQKLSY